jgi:hypothetical protein
MTRGGVRLRGLTPGWTMCNAFGVGEVPVKEPAYVMGKLHLHLCRACEADGKQMYLCRWKMALAVGQS